MAKKIKLDDEIKEPYIPTPQPKDPLAEKVLALRDKGFDNNRIAANLMIHKSVVDKI